SNFHPSRGTNRLNNRVRRVRFRNNLELRSVTRVEPCKEILHNGALVLLLDRTAVGHKSWLKLVSASPFAWRWTIECQKTSISTSSMGVELSFFIDTFSLFSNQRKCAGSKSHNLADLPSTVSLIRPADIAKSADPAG